MSKAGWHQGVHGRALVDNFLAFRHSQNIKSAEGNIQQILLAA